MNDLYYRKYLKYKQKYLDLKRMQKNIQKGGVLSKDNLTKILSILKYIEYIDTNRQQLNKENKHKYKIFARYLSLCVMYIIPEIRTINAGNNPLINMDNSKFNEIMRLPSFGRIYDFVQKNCCSDMDKLNFAGYKMIVNYFKDNYRRINLDNTYINNLYEESVKIYSDLNSDLKRLLPEEWKDDDDDNDDDNDDDEMLHINLEKDVRKITEKSDTHVPNIESPNTRSEDHDVLEREMHTTAKKQFEDMKERQQKRDIEVVEELKRREDAKLNRLLTQSAKLEEETSRFEKKSGTEKKSPTQNTLLSIFKRSPVPTPSPASSPASLSPAPAKRSTRSSSPSIPSTPSSRSSFTSASSPAPSPASLSLSPATRSFTPSPQKPSQAPSQAPSLLKKSKKPTSLTPPERVTPPEIIVTPARENVPTPTSSIYHPILGRDPLDEDYARIQRNIGEIRSIHENISRA